VTPPTVPIPTPTVSLPVPTPAVTVPSVPAVPARDGAGSPASSISTGGTTSGAPQGGGANSAGTARRATPRSTVKPIIVGRPEAGDLLDEESTPALYRASKAFLAADTKIAALSEARDAMDAARDGAQRAAASYTSLQTDAANARAEAATLNQRNDRLHAMIISDAVQSYQTGEAATDDQSTRDLVAAATRADDAATQAEMQVGLRRHRTGPREGRLRSPFGAVRDGAAGPSRRRPAARRAGAAAHHRTERRAKRQER
jgi:hypothetical protein